MARVKRGVTAGRRHKKMLGKAKGYYGARSRTYRTAKQAVIKAGQYAFRDRRAKKRDFRALSVAIPVFAYICRYSFEISTKESRALSEVVHRDRSQTRGQL